MDGRPWRTVPERVVAACGLAAGVELDRPLLRSLRRELRQAEALTVAGRVLQRRDISRRALEERLARAGVPPAARAEAVYGLAGAGVLDDGRYADRRAGVLAERGWGDAAIRVRLEQEGVGRDQAEAAIAQLEPEGERALRVAGTVRDPRKAWGRLARRGFDPDTVAEALRALDGAEGGGLG